MKLSICHLPFAICLALSGTASAAPLTASNSAPILINDSPTPPTLATPYGSTLVVTGLTGSIVTKVTVTLNSFSHDFPSDVDMLLVGPQGQMSFLMSKVGGSQRYSVTNLTLTFDDDAASSLPTNSTLVSGTFQPTKKLSNLNFDLPSPAPAGSSNAPASLAVFKGIEANGTWSLFVVDDTSPDSGEISGGWSLTITTTPVLLAITRAGANIILSWTNAAVGYTLQTTTNLLSSAAWTNATPPAVDLSGRFTVTNAISGPRRFYRLMK